MSSLKYLSLLLFALTLAGCGMTSQQIVKTQSFGTATSNVGTFAESEFVNIRNGIIEMSKENLIINHQVDSRGLTFDRPTSAESAAVRVAAAKAIKLYGELLVKLATEDRSDGLKKVTNALIDNTSVALDQNFSDEKKDAITQIVASIGSLWVDKKKADAAKLIIPTYAPAVEKLADLLIVDFSLDSNGYLKGYWNEAKILRLSSIELVDAGKKYTLFERDRAVQAFVLAERNIHYAENIDKKAKESLQALKKANAELVSVIRSDNYSSNDIKIYAKKIQEFMNLYEVISN